MSLNLNPVGLLVSSSAVGYLRPWQISIPVVSGTTVFSRGKLSVNVSEETLLPCCTVLGVSVMATASLNRHPIYSSELSPMPPACASLFQMPCPLSGRVDLAFPSPSLLGLFKFCFILSPSLVFDIPGKLQTFEGGNM